MSPPQVQYPLYLSESLCIGVFRVLCSSYSLWLITVHVFVVIEQFVILSRL